MSKTTTLSTFQFDEKTLLIIRKALTASRAHLRKQEQGFVRVRDYVSANAVKTQLREQDQAFVSLQEALDDVQRQKEEAFLDGDTEVCVCQCGFGPSHPAH